MREKGGGGPWDARAKPQGTFRPYQPLEPQPRGAVTRRAVAQRRSRASGLTRPLAEAIRGFWVRFWGLILLSVRLLVSPRYGVRYLFSVIYL